MSLQPVVSMVLMGLPAVAALVALSLLGSVPRHRRGPTLVGALLIVVGGVLDLASHILLFGFVTLGLPLWLPSVVNHLTWFLLVIGVLLLALAATRRRVAGSPRVRRAPAAGPPPFASEHHGTHPSDRPRPHAPGDR